MDGRFALFLAGALIGVLLLGSCSENASPPEGGTEPRPLPPMNPDRRLDDLLTTRGSVQSFSPEALAESRSANCCGPCMA